MSRNLDPSEVVITAEHRRFAEFCDACRRYAYIGLCYGSPGVGKTISARYYTNWNHIEAYVPFRAASGPGPVALLGSATVFYTPKVVHSPKQIEQDIALWRLRLHAIPLEVLPYEEEQALERAKNRRGRNGLRWTAPSLRAPNSQRCHRQRSSGCPHKSTSSTPKNGRTPPIPPRYS